MLKGEMYSNSLCAEGYLKGVNQDILSRNQQNINVDWIMCLLDAKDACEVKGIVSNTCLQYSY
jgi:hypothetical protein